MPLSDDVYLNQILDQALALPITERRAFLNEACENAEVREKIIQLMAGCEIDVPEEFLQPSAASKQWIEQAYRKLKKGRLPGGL